MLNLILLFCSVWQKPSVMRKNAGALGLKLGQICSGADFLYPAHFT